MRKHRIAIAVSVAIAATFGTGANAQAPAVKNLKLQGSWPASLTIQDHFKGITERIEKLTGGSIKIETMSAGQVVPPFEVLDATNKKVIDGWHSISYYWVGKSPAAALFSGPPGGPFGMDHMDWLGWMYVGGGLEMWRDFYQNELKLNVIVWPAQPSSPQAFGWFKKPLRSVADLKGLKCRQTGLNAELYAKLGMAVVNLPGGEIVPAAQRGVIDAAEWIGPADDLNLGLQTVWKNYYLQGLHQSTDIGEVLINKAVWAKLAPDLQEIMRAAALASMTETYSYNVYKNALAVKRLREEFKVTIHDTPKDFFPEFVRATQVVLTKYADKDPFFKQVLDSQRNFAVTVVPYWTKILDLYSNLGNAALQKK